MALGRALVAAVAAKARNINVALVCDLVHVVEYLWKATWSLHPEADPAAEQWVRRQALAVLDGNALKVARTIRRQATKAALSPTQRKGADAAADYLSSKAPYLDYPTALTSGWPIATGVIEGACRHIVADRFDVTGARWGLAGAEAILKLRALRSNGDFETYWDLCGLPHKVHQGYSSERTGHKMSCPQGARDGTDCGSSDGPSGQVRSDEYP